MTSIRIWTRDELRAAKRRFGPIDADVVAGIVGAHATVPEIKCVKGCNHCCQLKVEAYPVEIARIVDSLKARLPAGEQFHLMQRMQANAALEGTQDAKGYRDAGLQCALLLGGLCSVYEIRPWSCRSMASTNVGICAHTEPDDGQSRVTGNPFGQAMYGIKEDTPPTDFNRGMLEYWITGKITVTEMDDQWQARALVLSGLSMTQEQSK